MSVAKVSLVANTSPISNVETYLNPPFLIPGGSAANGDVFRITVAGKRSDADAFNYTYNVRLGTNGNTTDPVILTVPGSRSVGDGKTGFFDEFLVTVRANGSSGNVVASGSNFGGNPAIGSPVSYNTTLNNYLGVSFVTSDKFANVVFVTAVAEQVN